MALPLSTHQRISIVSVCMMIPGPDKVGVWDVPIRGLYGKQGRRAMVRFFFNFLLWEKLMGAGVV